MKTLYETLLDRDHALDVSAWAVFTPLKDWFDKKYETSKSMFYFQNGYTRKFTYGDADQTKIAFEQIKMTILNEMMIKKISSYRAALSAMKKGKAVILINSNTIDLLTMPDPDRPVKAGISPYWGIRLRAGNTHDPDVTFVQAAEFESAAWRAGDPIPSGSIEQYEISNEGLLDLVDAIFRSSFYPSSHFVYSMNKIKERIK